VNRIVIWTGIVLTGFIITGISFVAMKRADAGGAYGLVSQDKAELIYKRAEAFIEDEEYDEAENALLTIALEYSDSSYAGKSLRKVAEIYIEKGNYKKARDIYKRLLIDFPMFQSSGEIRSDIENLNMRIMFSPTLAENSVEYEIQSGDTLFAVAKKFNTTVELLKKVNDLKTDLIHPGQHIKIVLSEFSIFVDKSDNTLTLNGDEEIIKTYSVSTGKNNCTPVGVFKIEEKMVKPPWYKVGSVVSADSKEYELGARWMGLSLEGYGIHGTSDENSIGKQVTQGCVRMHNADIVELYTIVPSGTKVEIVD